MSIEVITQSLFASSTDRPAEWFDANGNAILQRNLYKVDGVTGINADGTLSIGQLVMALCLARATELEDAIIAMMNELSENTEKLNLLTDIQSYLTDWLADHATSSSTLSGSAYKVTDLDGVERNWDYVLINEFGLSANGDHSPYYKSTVESFVSQLDAKLDELNTFSQETMISLQSTTNKRDQAYDMISNILKSLNTTLTGNANNI